MALSSLLKPPRRSGDIQSDFIALNDWAGDLWEELLAITPLAIVELSVAGFESTVTHTFAAPRSNDTYRVFIQVTDFTNAGDPIPSEAFNVTRIVRTRAGFTVFFGLSPGGLNSITVDAFLFET